MRWALVLLLAGCAAAPDLPIIRISEKPGFLRVDRVIRADDWVTTSVENGTTGAKRQPGAYAAALTILQAEGPETAEKLAHGPEVCLDYGTDVVAQLPPGVIDTIASDCPDPALKGLIAALDAVLE